jgi:uroporphyrinogen-III synthase
VNKVNNLIDLDNVNYVTLSSPSGVESFLNYYKNIPSALKFLVKGKTTRDTLLSKNFGMDRIELFDDFAKITPV